MPIELNDSQKKDLLDRFLRFVKIDTQSDENSTTSPSTEKQKDLSRLLVDELKALGCVDAEMDEWGYVFATVEANPPELESKVPIIGLLAHVDTAFGCSGKNVNPQVIENYDGSDISLPNNPELVIKVADNPNLPKVVGTTVITTDGTTLLGADDKAGIAEILGAITWLREHPEFEHGKIRIGFTTDEEIGRGTENFSVPKFGANVAYTIDGSDLGEIEDETFCADMAKITFEGVDVHPGYAKDKMTNAVRASAAFVAGLDEKFLPETTDSRESYLHAYDIHGDVSKVELKVLLRAFTEEDLADRAGALQAVAASVRAKFPASKIDVTINEQYRNMGFHLSQTPEVVDYAIEAVRRQGIEPHKHSIRGGTDGARLTFMGLPTPNIWAGGQNFHGLSEWVSLDWMAKASATIVAMLGVWTEKSR